jgi:hypothetical protein
VLPVLGISCFTIVGLYLPPRTVIQYYAKGYELYEYHWKGERKKQNATLVVVRTLLRAASLLWLSRESYKLHRSNF